MCGQCGVRHTGWTERIAPLDRAGAAARRARALTALMRAAPHARTRRTSATAWHGGGLRLRDPGGWRFAPSLLDALRDLTARNGPLLPLHECEPREPQVSAPPAFPGGPARTSRGCASAPARPPEAMALAFDVCPEAAAVWCAALAAADVPRHGTVTLWTGAFRVSLTRESVDVSAAEHHDGPALSVDGGSALPADRAKALAEHWRRTLPEFRSAPGQASCDPAARGSGGQISPSGCRSASVSSA